MRAAISQLLLHGEDEPALLAQIVDSAVRIGGLQLAFIAQPNADGDFRILAASGDLTCLDVLTGGEQDESPTRQAWQRGDMVLLASLAALRPLAPWQRQALQQGIRAGVALPIHKNGQPWAILGLFHPHEALGDDAAIRQAMSQFAADLGMGLDRLDARLLQQALLDNTRVGIALVRSRIIERSNANCARMLGYTLPQLVGQSVRAIYPDEHEYRRVGEAYHQMQRDGRVSLHGVRYARCDGDVLLCDVTGVRLQGSSDEWSVWTIEDVTRREQQARRMQTLVQFNAWLAEINRQGSLCDSEQALFAAVCQAGVSQGGMMLAWIGRPDPDNGRFSVLAAEGQVDYLANVHISALAGVIGGNGPTGIAWREARPVFAARYHHPELQSPWLAMAQRHRFGAFAALPILVQGEPSAVLTVYCQYEDVFDHDSQHVLQALASSIGHGLHEIWQRHRIISLQHLYRALMSEGDVVLQARSASEMLLRTCEKLIDGTQFHAVWVGRPNIDGRFEVLASAGCGTVELPQVELPLMPQQGCPLVLRAWRSAQLVVNNDHLDDPLLAPWREFNQRHGWHAALAAPVWRAGQCWAVLMFVSPQRDVFDEQTIELCQFVAALLGHGLDEMDLKQRLSLMQREEAHRARHDALTGLPNRYALEQHLEHAIALARRQGTLVAVGMIDLDDFKPVNDTWGHEAGDRLLQELSQRLKKALRSADMLARLGGDEFLLVIEGLDEQQLQQQLQRVCERLHQGVEQGFEVMPGQLASVGMSMGLAVFPRDALDPDLLMRQADVAMYQAKLHKHERSRWWCQAGEVSDAAMVDQVFDPYGAEAAVLLQRLHAPLEQVIHEFSAAFFRQGHAGLPIADILTSLDESMLQHLRQAQAQHCRYLLAPDTTREGIIQRGQQIGGVHALVGVSSTLLTQSRALFRQKLGEQLNRSLLSARERYRVLLAADARMQDDLQAELEGAQSVQDAYQVLLSRPLPPEDVQPVEAWHSELEAIGQLPGVLACQLLRPNAQGIFQVEASAGDMAEPIREILATPGMQPVFDTREQAGRGVIPLAWRSGNPETCAVYGRDPRTATWHPVLDRVPIRSMVVIPIRDGSGDAAHVLAIQGRMPNQFESRSMQQFAAGLQQRLCTIWQRFSPVGQAAGIEETAARRYREQLFAGGLEMFMQPIVCLRSGKLRKVEALARLRMPDGSLVAPGVFLPLLSNVEFDRLFRLGLDQALYWLVNWEAQGLTLEVTVNLPPHTLLDPACVAWVEEALNRYGIAPERLHLELLENQSIDFASQNQAIARLNELGVHLAMDDLGSGYSSLQRLSALLFRTIKSDQALLARAQDNPVQTLSLLGAIIQMGRDFDCEVVVEGLEDETMVEAAALLGAHYGQGYALARPMPAEELLRWQQHFVLPVQHGQIQSEMGALAYLWLVMHSEGCHPPQHLNRCPLGRFLDTLGPDADVAHYWHSAIHQGEGRQEAAQRLMTWLAARIRQRHAPMPALQPGLLPSNAG
ncbi:hypothetical protein THUN1379_25520 [Paludibacterium sp. THUN1379]|uniref:EAL domain-containing protein n=1 Tax=Paludibacterium sp. THUN1379 TaxID=3112107 RepID=UPI00308F471F|nr:hypothetical protein THUN1379_25520 [Paludibacterium sp. THUN1379]